MGRATSGRSCAPRGWLAGGPHAGARSRGRRQVRRGHGTPSAGPRGQGRRVAAMIDWGEVATFILVRLEWLILVYFLFVNTFYGVLLASAALEMRRHLRRAWHQSRWRLLSSEVAPSVTMLAPAYNEGPT